MDCLCPPFHVPLTPGTSGFSKGVFKGRRVFWPAGPVGAERAERLKSAAEAEAGPGKHPYFAARGLVLDTEVEQALQALHSCHPGSMLQVGS
eukprot:scaffold199672_cov14-Tisochrysis_lutea.AAC.1